jgi:hypothetical protein
MQIVRVEHVGSPGCEAEETSAAREIEILPTPHLGETPGRFREHGGQVAGRPGQSSPSLGAFQALCNLPPAARPSMSTGLVRNGDDIWVVSPLSADRKPGGIPARTTGLEEIPGYAGGTTRDVGGIDV